jgi:putative membrane protein
MKVTLRTALLAALAASGLMFLSAAQAKSDAAFMKDAAQAGDAEVQASRLAQTKARRADVKAFADTMVSDHTRLADELKTLAASKQVKLPAGASLMQKSKLKLIQAGDDAKFDERYVTSFGVQAHQDTIKLFEDAAQHAKDADVKAFAQKALPGLQHHLEMAQALAPK